MTKQREQITVRCPKCEVVIEHVTPETMVYCLACRKWCREVEAVRAASTSNATPSLRPRRRVRCH